MDRRQAFKNWLRMRGTARLMNWGARVLYVGPAFGLTPHRNATAVLAAGLDGELGVAKDLAVRTPSYHRARSVLILPNSLHHLRIDGGRMAFLYVDPLGQDLAALRRRMRKAGSGAAFDLIDEAAVVTALKGFIERRLSPQEIRSAMSDLLGVGSRPNPDRRIADALRRMRDEPGCAHRLVELSRHAGLSPSRFLHLFKAETGVPLRRYRIWNRIGAASRAVAEGKSLTEAAHGAGFSSSAHFSSAFRDMFGVMPSQLFACLKPIGIRQA